MVWENENGEEEEEEVEFGEEDFFLLIGRIFVFICGWGVVFGVE